MRAKEEAFRILEAALSVASSGVDEAEVCLGGGDLAVTTFANNLVQPSQEHSFEILTVRVGSKGRMVRLATTDLSSQGLREVATQAHNRAEHLPERARGVGLPEPQSYLQTDAYDPEAELFRALERTAVAGRAIIAAHQQGLTASGQIAVRRGSLGLDGSPGIYAIANTRGLLAYHPETRVGLRLALRNKSGASSWVEDESFAVSALEPEAMTKTALRRALIPGEPRRLEAGRHTAVLEAAAVGALLGPVSLGAGATAYAAGRSFLSGRLGQSITGRNINLHDDHAHPLHRGRPFDFEGVAKKRVTLIEGGVARGPVHSLESAVRSGGHATGHRIWDPEVGETESATHLVMDGGSATLSDLVGSTGRGLLIGRIGALELVDPRQLLMTGTTQEGCFVIDGGELVAPLAPTRFAFSLLELLGKVEALGNVSWANGAVVPSLKVELPLFAA